MSNHPQKSGSLCSGMSGSLCSGIGGSLYPGIGGSLYPGMSGSLYSGILKLLSLYEIFKNYSSDNNINFSFFGDKNDAFYGKDVNKTIQNDLDGSYWSKAGFSVLFFTNGNNVFNENY